MNISERIVERATDACDVVLVTKNYNLSSAKLERSTTVVSRAALRNEVVEAIKASFEIEGYKASNSQWKAMEGSLSFINYEYA